MKPKLAVLLLLIALTFLVALLDDLLTRPTIVTAQPQKQTMPAPDITFDLLAGGKPVPLRQYRGRYVLLNVWASWCAPCAAEFPALLKLAKEHPKRLVLITLSADQNPEDAKAFLARFDAPASNVLHSYDHAKKISQESFQIYYYPESILIDPDGQMILKIAGMLSADDIRAITQHLQLSAEQ